MSDFATFFDRATKGRTPYPYQIRLATDEPMPHLVRVPTGAGKTAAAVLAWLWRLRVSPTTTPRRLIYCLPMRVLVEQSLRETRTWVENIQADVHVDVLMGGADADEWYLYPERPTILIGTQDMLLSRALNRGYAASKFHWPMDFAHLNNDCLWIFDEPQLMANGVPTSAQLAGLRAKLGTFGHTHSVWMSATLEPEWLDTVDFGGQSKQKPIELTSEDFDERLPLFRRMTADKKLASLPVASSSNMKDVAATVVAKHLPGTQSLAVVNTVERAKALFEEVSKLLKKGASTELLLIHSRYRAKDRAERNDKLKAEATDRDRIIVATQVVEAGVDISARTLFTELCPWPSMVQRMGRCNRTGNDGPGLVYWVDLGAKLAAPYEEEELQFARTFLRELEGFSVSPQALDEFKKRKQYKLPFTHEHVLRRRDILDLFDTTPDLTGGDIDVARFVRGDDPDTDVQVFWRDLSREIGDSAATRDELCRVPVEALRAFVKDLKDPKRGRALKWDHIDGEWRPLDARQLRPGMIVMLPTTAGGYSHLGWDPASREPVAAVDVDRTLAEEGAGSDPNSIIGAKLTLREHTDHVVDMLATFIDHLPCGAFREQLMRAARWHDVGKAAAPFQQAMYDPETPDGGVLLAKSGRHGKIDYGRFGRRYFRHELASALCLLQLRPDWPFIIPYVVAAHHGRVRVSIRSLPDEQPPAGDAGRLFALGIHDGDSLPAAELGGDVSSPVQLDLGPMELGHDRSWTASVLQLLNDIGPFRLAFLETVLRAADVRASKKEQAK